MNKIWLVIRYEFWRHVTRRGFLIGIVGFPALIGVVMAASIWFFSQGQDTPIGIVDGAGFTLSPPAYAAANEGSIPFKSFAEPAEAAETLEAGELQAYVVIEADYLESGRLRIYHNDNLAQNFNTDLRNYLRASLLASVDSPAGLSPGLSVTTIDVSHEAGSLRPLGLLAGVFGGMIFVVAVMTVSSYLVSAVADEKENRTMEILATSIKPEQLMAGKIVGLVGVGLVQIMLWVIISLIGVQILQSRAPQFAGPDTWRILFSTLAIALAWFLPLFIMVAGLITAIAISVTTVSEAQQMTGIVMLFPFIPLYFIGPLMSNPHSSLVVTVSLIPFTAPMMMIMRTQITAVPLWQMALSWGILAATAVFYVWLGGRVLRAGMLRYGKKLTLREVWSALR